MKFCHMILGSKFMFIPKRQSIVCVCVCVLHGNYSPVYFLRQRSLWSLLVPASLVHQLALAGVGQGWGCPPVSVSPVLAYRRLPHSYSFYVGSYDAHPGPLTCMGSVYLLSHVSSSWPTISLVPYDYERVSLIYFAFHVYYHDLRVI